MNVGDKIGYVPDMCYAKTIDPNTMEPAWVFGKRERVGREMGIKELTAAELLQMLRDINHNKSLAKDLVLVRPNHVWEGTVTAVLSPTRAAICVDLPHQFTRPGTYAPRHQMDAQVDIDPTGKKPHSCHLLPPPTADQAAASTIEKALDTLTAGGAQ